ncbi:MAG: NusG domain II-containing protein [Eubacteriaceae bacterium]|nr:NusG domain II-containing protein [Eubacteriaceae bacterium]
MQGSFFRKKDIFVILALLLIAGVIYFINLPGEAGNVAEIRIDGVLVSTVKLADGNDGIYKLEGVNVEYEIKDGKIRFYSSDCPDHVCIEDGFVNLGGESVVCLPNRVVISIPRGNGKDSEIDIMLH